MPLTYLDIIRSHHLTNEEFIRKTLAAPIEAGDQNRGDPALHYARLILARDTQVIEAHTATTSESYQQIMHKKDQYNQAIDDFKILHSPNIEQIKTHYNKHYEPHVLHTLSQCELKHKGEGCGTGYTLALASRCFDANDVCYNEKKGITLLKLAYNYGNVTAGYHAANHLYGIASKQAFDDHDISKAHSNQVEALKIYLDLAQKPGFAEKASQLGKAIINGWSLKEKTDYGYKVTPFHYPNWKNEHKELAGKVNEFLANDLEKTTQAK